LRQVPAINNTGKKSYVVAGVIRYNSTAQNWEQITGAHTPLNTSSIACPTNDTIQINYDLASVTNKTVVSFIVTPDEQLAGIGVFAGSSVGVDSATVYLYTSGYGAYIAYNGSAWTQLHGSGFPDVSMAWSTDKLQITVPYAMEAICYHWANLTGKDTPYQVCLGSVGTNTIDIVFYNAAGTKVTTPDTNMKFFIQFGNRRMNVKGASTIPNAFGNLWYMGIIQGDP
jgi:hypothetical protein